MKTVDLRILIELCNFQTLKEEFDFVTSTFLVAHQTKKQLQARVNVLQTFGILQVLIEEVNFEPFSGKLNPFLHIVASTQQTTELVLENYSFTLQL